MRCHPNPLPSETPVRPFWSRDPVRLGLLLLLLPMCGCGGPFTVNPRAAVPPTAAELPASRVGPLSISAEKVIDENFLYEAFDSNLIMAGVLPVWIKVVNNGAAPLDLKKTEYAVAGPSGAAYKRLDPAKVYKRLLSYYQIRAYTRSAYKHSRADFDSTALDLGSPLQPAGSREGYVFFSVPSDIARGGGLKLVMRKIVEPAGKADQWIHVDL